MSDTYTNPLSFIFGSKPGGAVPTYEQLQTRRKIAAAMMSQRQPYPKNLGEGLAAIGDALGARGYYNSLEADEAAKGVQDQQLLRDVGIGGQPTAATTSSAATPGYAPPDDTVTKPPAVAAIDSAITPQPPTTQPAPTASAEPGVSDGGYNFLDASAGMKATMPGYLQNAITSATSDPDMQAYLGSLSAREAPKGPGDVSPTGASGPYQFTRSTGKQYGLMGAGGDQRADINASTAAALKLTQDNIAAFQNANGRPPTMAELAVMHQQGQAGGLNLMAGRPTVPGNLAVNNIDPSSSPQAAVARIKNFYGLPDRPVGSRDAVASAVVAQAAPAPDQRLAFNGQPSAAPQPAPITPAPPVAPQIRTAPTAPALGPQVAQPAAPQLRAPTTEPTMPVRPPPTLDMQKLQAAMATRGAGDPILPVLQNKLQQLQQDQEKQFQQDVEEFRHKRDLWESAPQKQQELTKAATEARFGGAIPYQQFIADMSKGYDATQQVANGLPTIRQAKDALAQSYTGSGADAKLDASKMLRTMGVPGNYSATEATEVLRSRLKAIAGGLIKATVGSQNISDADRAFVEQAYSGTLSMEPGSLRRLLDISQNVTTETINRHNDRLLGVANDPEADRAIRNTYRVPMQYAPADVSYLKEHPDASNAAKFDARYGKGHARAVLGGANYGE